MRFLRRTSVLLVLLTVVPNGLAAQDSAQIPCSAPEYRQFDFWVGEWDLTWPDSGRGTNTITHLLDSCTIQERFTTLGDNPFRGRSLSTYDAWRHKWRQTWVDNRGYYLDFEGEFVDGQMILMRRAIEHDGTEFLQRMVWFNITEDSLDWHWERSDNGGQTWQTLWEIHYVRRK
jgi:hypothetical protein